MNLRLMKIRDALASSFWFLPALMALVAGGMALGTVTLDHALGSGWVRDMGWVWSGGADGAATSYSCVALPSLGALATGSEIVSKAAPPGVRADEKLELTNAEGCHAGEVLFSRASRSVLLVRTSSRAAARGSLRKARQDAAIVVRTARCYVPREL